jgi:hypothetical protein
MLSLSSLVFSPAGVRAEDANPYSVATAFNRALDAHDVDAALALFADDARVSTADGAIAGTEIGSSYVGKAQIRGWLEWLTDDNLFVDATDYLVTGNQVTYRVTLSWGTMPWYSPTVYRGTVVLLVQGGKIQSYDLIGRAEVRDGGA